jgi:hypothetical protein
MIPPIMEPDEVLEIATIKREFVEKIAPELEDYGVVLTGERLAHIKSSRASEPLALERIQMIPKVLANPDKVLKDQDDIRVVNFLWFDDSMKKYLRVTVWLNIDAEEGKRNSVWGFRLARQGEVKVAERAGLVIYER